MHIYVWTRPHSVLNSLFLKALDYKPSMEIVQHTFAQPAVWGPEKLDLPDSTRTHCAVKKRSRGIVQFIVVHYFRVCKRKRDENWGCPDCLAYIDFRLASAEQWLLVCAGFAEV